jgi:hypothetical protein
MKNKKIEIVTPDIELFFGLGAIPLEMSCLSGVKTL